MSEMSDNFVHTGTASGGASTCSQPERDAAILADSDTDAEQLARRFHETYERLAPSFGYETRKDSAVPWESVPEKNRKLMIAVCAEIGAAQSAAVAAALEAERTKAALDELNRRGHDSDCRDGQWLLGLNVTSTLGCTCGLETRLTELRARAEGQTGGGK